MHAEAYQFVQQTVADISMRGKKVLEIGSYNINGSVRPLFSGAAEYVGIDPRMGPGVDLTFAAADYDGEQRFHIVVCCETLEHAPDPEGVIGCAERALKPGGLFILTAAGEERTPHGVNGGPLNGEHYQNITRTDLRGWLKGWADVHITTNPDAGDIYAVATKPAPDKEKTTDKDKE